MDIIDERRAIIQPLHKFWYEKKVEAIDMLRLDLLHPVVSGNKWFKLRLNMKHALEKGLKTIVTFGGGYSNHLVATAFAARHFGLEAIGIVRGAHDNLTPTLRDCKEAGMELIFVTHDDYKKKHEPNWAKNLVTHFDELLIIPEGGDNELGRAGAGLIERFINDSYTHIAVSVGSGTTLTGLRNKLSTSQRIIGFAPMKQGSYLKEHIAKHLLPEQNQNWDVLDNWHFGGFGKWDRELLRFMNSFHKENQVPLDIVYTSKMMYGIHEMLHNNEFSSCDRILCIHTGGLQGNASVRNELDY
jgi:1-aminocyclopropane-1-carboxylate deaminase